MQWIWCRLVDPHPQPCGGKIRKAVPLHDPPHSLCLPRCCKASATHSQQRYLRPCHMSCRCTLGLQWCPGPPCSGSRPGSKANTEMVNRANTSCLSWKHLRKWAMQTSHLTHENHRTLDWVLPQKMQLAQLRFSGCLLVLATNHGSVCFSEPSSPSGTLRWEKEEAQIGDAFRRRRIHKTTSQLKENTLIV